MYNEMYNITNRTKRWAINLHISLLNTVSRLMFHNRFKSILKSFRTALYNEDEHECLIDFLFDYLYQVSVYE